MTFSTIERTIVDWFEANSIPVEHRGDEWFAMTEDGVFSLALTELAMAVHQAASAELTGSYK